jgi:hypothetical protein
VRVELVYLSLVVVYREQYDQEGADQRRNRPGKGAVQCCTVGTAAQQVGRVVRIRTGGTTA